MLIRRFLAGLLVSLLAFAPAETIAPLAPPVISVSVAAAAFVPLVPAKAHAATTAQTAAVLSGIQSWSLPGSSADLYFALNAGSCAINRLARPCASLLSTTRASTGYGQWADGHYSSFGNNVPRITDQGLLVEQAATNLQIQSNNPATSWTATNLVAVNGAITGPDQVANSAGSLTDNSTNGLHGIATTSAGGINYTSGTTYTFSALVQPGTATVIQFTLGNTGSSFSGLGYANFNLTGSGSKTTGGTLAGSGITAYPNGWYLVWISETCTSSQNTFALINLTGNSTVLSRNGTYVGTGQTLYVWGIQIEAGSFPTSPILTTTGSATRAFDNISPSGAALTALQASSGTIIVSLGGGIASQTGTILGINSLIGLGKTSGNALTTAFGGAQTSGNTATWTGNVKAGLRWTPSTVGLVLNGGTIVSAANTPPAVTSAFMGSTSGSSAAINQFIKRLTVIPSAVSDAQFQSLTQ